MYAGMLQYDADLNIPHNFLTYPPKIKYTLSEHLVKHGIRMYAISETQKYGHVTYFWNGNRSEKFDENLETYEEVKSDVVPFEQRPWMKSAEITDKLIEAIKSGEYDFLRTNYPNGDMVGHTGIESAVVKAIETVDTCVGKAVEALKEVDGTMFICADHGNAEQLIDYKTGEPFTAHTTNPVPFILVNYDEAYTLKEGGKLCDIVPTLIEIMGMEKPKEMTGESLLVKKNS